MRGSFGIDPRVWLLSGLATLAVPPAAVGLAALGLPLAVAGAAVVAAAVAVVAVTWRRLPDTIGQPVRGRPLLLAVWLAMTVVAATQTVRLSTFIHDVEQAHLSVLPERDFFRKHACLSAYTEASRIAPSGKNVYDPSTYRGRTIGRLEVDLFQYPPAFLLLGGSLRAISEDFLANRAVWFLVQALAFLAAALALALWIGGAAGASAAWLIPAIWLGTTTLLTLQLGNFQISAFSWSIGAMLLAAGGWAAAAGALLGFCAAGKLFPGVLVLYMAMRQQWRPVFATAAWAAIWLAVAIAWFGMKPQWDFLLYQVPRIQSGEAFFWIDDASAAPINYSVYGFVARLRALGVPGTTRDVGNGLASLYGASILLLAAYLGWRTRRVPIGSAGTRLSEAMLWLALLNLGSLRSPFVPDAYALVGTVWLGTLVVAGLERRTIGIAAVAAVLWLAFTRVFDGLLPDGVPAPTWMLVASLLIQVAAVSVNVVAIRMALHKSDGVRS